ncbi:MAG: IS66 family insertion sequence element accessory protein TnpB [Methylobacter sp.]|nr:IS66 family insertion sequence element accessory protein TnpB [Methylobacter sp.]
MALSAHWKNYIETWQSSGLSQAAYCRQQSLNAQSFSNQLHAFRSQCATQSPTLIPVQIQDPLPESIVLQLVEGHRLELRASVSAQWLAELLRCLVLSQR